MLGILALGIQSYLLRYGDWRYSYVGFEGPVVPSVTWIPRVGYEYVLLVCRKDVDLRQA